MEYKLKDSPAFVVENLYCQIISDGKAKLKK